MERTPAFPDLPSRAFRPRVFGVGAWTDNLPFAYDLIARLKPRVVVELGTDRGESYFAFCQSAAENSAATRCFAVDTWRGDHQTGDYDETTFAEVSAHNAAHYAGFSTLLRCCFDEALDQFPSGSIDVLHLDGLHTEAAVRHDVEAWLPKVREGGIFLLHDISVRTRNFGVWKVWGELRGAGRSHAFADGPGLGVLQKFPAALLPDPLEALLTAPNDAALDLERYYRTWVGELQKQIAQQWGDGTIRETAAAQQTVIQVFHTHDGTHREEDSVNARIGHESWKDISIALPSGSGAAPLRIDFVSAFTTIDLAAIAVSSPHGEQYRAESSAEFDAILISGDCRREAHGRYLRLKVMGPDPQLYLPPLQNAENAEQLVVSMRLRVSVHSAPNE